MWNYYTQRLRKLFVVGIANKPYPVVLSDKTSVTSNQALVLTSFSGESGQRGERWSVDEGKLVHVSYYYDSSLLLLN